MHDGPDTHAGLPPFIGVGASENKIDSNLGQLLRVVNQDFVDSQITLYVNGNCHGQLVFEQDMRWNIHGKKAIKSI